jgi:YD repeat-containing protein
MRAFPAALLSVACAVSLASCAQTAPPGVTVVSQSADPSATATWKSDAPVTLQVGSSTDLSQTRGLAKAVVTVESITEKVACPTGATKPKNGQFIAVKISATRLDTSEGFGMAVYEWGSLDGTGKAVTGNAGLVTGLCLTDGTALKLAWDASGRAAGTLLIDAPTTVTAITATNTMITPSVTVTLAMPAR